MRWWVAIPASQWMERPLTERVSLLWDTRCYVRMDEDGEAVIIRGDEKMPPLVRHLAEQ